MAKVVAAESEVHIMSTQRKNMFKATDQYDRKETTPIFLIHQKPSSPVKDPKNKRNFLNFHLFHWWTVCSYYALYIPFKPVTRTRINGRFELKINKFQWVAMVYLIFVSASKIIISVFYMLILGSSWTSKIIPPSEQFHVAVVNGRKRFFFLTGFLNASTPHSPEDIVYGVSEILVKFLRQWDSCFEFALFCVVIPFTFWLTIEQFRKHFARPHLITNGDFSSNSESRLILEKYGELKRFVDSVNNIWSGVMLFWVFEMSLRNLWINNLFSTRNMVSIAHVVIETVFLTVAFVLMGEGSRIVS
ncbi:unnamed protein product [Orchesella dallaii]|uniref:Uncharacterized protein n=1 Tax=Orchesella dallaii TaxID=48710 RepID=A0ABP1RLB3_9HEXA